LPHTNGETIPSPHEIRQRDTDSKPTSALPVNFSNKKTAVRGGHKRHNWKLGSSRAGKKHKHTRGDPGRKRGPVRESKKNQKGEKKNNTSASRELGKDNRGRAITSLIAGHQTRNRALTSATSI